MFFHLHQHQHIGSIHDAISRPDQSAKRAKELGQEAMALSDHGSTGGLIKHYVACNEIGIKPILGVESYFVDDMKIKGKEANYCHLLLLAKTHKGYKNILKATSIAYTTGLIKKTQRGSIIGAIDWSVLPLLEDVVITTACVGGLVSKPFLNGDLESSKIRATKFRDLFGDDFYLELQLHNNAKELFERSNDYLISLSKELGIPLVATNDTHYVNKDDWTTHKAWLAIGHKMPLSHFNYVYDDTYYIKSEKEMRELELPEESIENTSKINDEIDWIDLNLGYGHIPDFMGMSDFEANNKLTDLVADGLKRINKQDNEEYLSRAEMELKFITEKGLSSYFFPIWDAINFARDNKIPIGPGRGSAAGSLVCYLIGITQADPLEYELPFGRFLNIGRIQRHKTWKVELEDGEEREIIEGGDYHFKEDNKWIIKKGEEIING